MTDYGQLLQEKVPKWKEGFEETTTRIAEGVVEKAESLLNMIGGKAHIVTGKYMFYLYLYGIALLGDIVVVAMVYGLLSHMPYLLQFTYGLSNPIIWFYMKMILSIVNLVVSGWYIFYFIGRFSMTFHMPEQVNWKEYIGKLPFQFPMAKENGEKDTGYLNGPVVYYATAAQVVFILGTVLGVAIYLVWLGWLIWVAVYFWTDPAFTYVYHALVIVVGVLWLIGAICLALSAIFYACTLYYVRQARQQQKEEQAKTTARVIFSSGLFDLKNAVIATSRFCQTRGLFQETQPKVMPTFANLTSFSQPPSETKVPLEIL